MTCVHALIHERYIQSTILFLLLTRLHAQCYSVSNCTEEAVDDRMMIHAGEGTMQWFSGHDFFS